MASSGVSNYLQNKVLVDWLLRAQTFTQLTNVYFALLTSTKGPRANSTTYAVNDTISLTANDGKTHLYKCTAITTGISAASQSTLYPGVSNEVIVDSGATFTEQDTALRAGIGGVIVEANYTGYSGTRPGLACSLANFAATQGGTVASTGTTGSTNNLGTITYGACTAGTNFVWGVAIMDASSAGNMLAFEGLSTVQTIATGSTPSFAVGALTLAWT